MSKFQSGIWALAAGAAASSLQCSAAEPSDFLLFAKGPVVLRPQLAVSETYNDNLFYRSRGIEDDFVTLISPGLNFQVGKREANYHLTIDYNFDELLYAKHPDVDSNQHRFVIGSQIRGNSLSLEGKDRIELLSSILGGGAFTSAQGLKVDRTTYSDIYTVRYAMTEKTSIYGRGSYSAVDFQNDLPLYDSNEWTGTGGFEWKALPKTSFFAETYYGQTATDPNAFLPKSPHSVFVGGFIGARGSFTEHLTGSAKAGYESRSFSDNSPGPSSPVVEISLVEQFREKTALSLSYSRKTYVSLEFASQAYDLDSVSLQLTQQIGSNERFKAKVAANYGLYAYENRGGFSRADNLFTGTAGLTYDIRRWMSAGFTYQFERYTSNVSSVIDYTVNRVTLGLVIGY